MLRNKTTPATPIPASILNQLPVLVNSATLVNENDPDVNQSPQDPGMFIDYDTSGVLKSTQRWAIYKFPEVLTSVRAILVVPRGRPFGWSFSIGDFANGAREKIATWRYELITASFDITTVTWNNKPASVALASNFSITCGQDTGFPGGMTGHAPESVVATADAIGNFHGFYIRPLSITVSVGPDEERTLQGLFLPAGVSGPLVFRTLA